MLILRKVLIRENQHRVSCKGLFNGEVVGRRDLPRQIDIADLGGKSRGDRPNGDCHIFPPPPSPHFQPAAAGEASPWDRPDCSQSRWGPPPTPSCAATTKDSNHRSGPGNRCRAGFRSPIWPVWVIFVGSTGSRHPRDVRCHVGLKSSETSSPLRRCI